MVDVPLYGFHNLLAVDNGDGTYTLKISGGAGGGGGSTIDRELVVVSYRVTTAFLGASVGDVVTSRRVLDVTDVPTQVGGTTWYNETTAAALGSAPSAANIVPLGAGGLTDAQLRAAAVAVSSVDLGATTDGAAPADGTGNYSVLSAFKRALLNGAAILAVAQAIQDRLPSAFRTPGLLSVDTLATLGVARQLAAGATTVNTALTTTCRRVSIHARTADIRYVIGTGAQTASATSHFIAAGERLDLDVPASAQIAVIRAGSTDGVLELSELI
jgi:hypothetical protein